MNDIAQLYISTDEDLRFRLTFANRGFAGRTLAIMIRERATNELKTTLTAPSRITISSTGPIPGVTPDPPASNDIVAALPKSLMAGWATGDYEADLLDVTVGSATRICPVRFTYDQPGRLVHGVEGNQATIYVNDENQAIITAVGGVGVPGPANTLAAGTIEMLAPSADPEITITGDSPNQVLNLKIPRGITGGTGPAGEIVSVDATTLSPGAPATVTNEGTATAAELVFGIPQGDQGEPGLPGVDGNDGWSPVFAVVPDGARRVMQVDDWVGGGGVKPAVGDYVGATGLTTVIGDAVDIRGPAGTVTIPDGDKGDITTADSGDTWTLNDGAVGTAELADGAATNAKLANMATDRLKGRTTAGSGPPEDLTQALVRTFLGITASGVDLITAASKADQRAALQITAAGEALLLAVDAATQRLALGASTNGAQIFTGATAAGKDLANAADLAAQKTLLGIDGSTKVHFAIDLTARSSSGTSYVAAGPAITVTPRSTTSKFRGIVMMNVGFSETMIPDFTVYRGATALTPAGKQSFVTPRPAISDVDGVINSVSFGFEDEPNTGSAVTYALHWKVNSGAIYLGRRGADTGIDVPSAFLILLES